MRCQIVKAEGGCWKKAELPKNIRKILPAISGAKPGDKRRYVDLREYGLGMVAAVKMPNGDIYDPELLKHGKSGWMRVKEQLITNTQKRR